jgi:hypothetical protein
VHFCTVLCSSVQFCAVLCISVQFYTILYISVQFCAVLYISVQFCTVLCSSTRFKTAVLLERSQDWTICSSDKSSFKIKMCMSVDREKLIGGNRNDERNLTYCHLLLSTKSHFDWLGFEPEPLKIKINFS